MAGDGLAPAQETGAADSPGRARLAGWQRVARISWIVLAVLAVGALLAAGPGYAAKFGGQLGHVTGNEIPPGAHFFAAASGVASLVAALLSFGLSALLFRRRFAEPMAIYVSFFLLLYAIVMAGPLEFAFYYWFDAVGIAQAIQGLLLAAPVVGLLMLFPSGQFVPRWARWVVLLSVPWSFGLLLLVPFDAEAISRQPVTATVLIALFLAFVASGIYAQVYRYRQTATAGEREQIRWAIYGFALWLAYSVLSSIPYMYLTSLPADAPTPWWAPASELGWWLSLTFLPVCLTVAITRYRLWDIDVVVNRTLVYGGLTTMVLALYALIVGGMGILFRANDSLALPLIATGLAAVLFHPLRQRLQSSINRMMYGDRDEPFEVLARLGERLESSLSPEMVYPTIVETVSQALKLPFVGLAVWRSGQLVLVESYGKEGPTQMTYPLTHQGEPVGQLLVSARAPDEGFSPADERILRNIARQAGAAVHAVQLMADLQASRQALVSTREEERRRLRRDLHDGLGPQLASQMLTIDAIDKLLDRDPERARALLRDLKSQAKGAVQDIRRVVYGLRPPALDELGLTGALREGAARQIGDGLRITVEAPEQMPPLPAAVEVAAYWVVQEATTNVIRHAQASHCRITLAVDRKRTPSTLQLEVRDDGRGLPSDYQTGVGFQSMRERATELGGSCQVTSNADGVCVTVSLPIQQHA